ncbi:aspartate-semialdehyde dehydrogenase [Janibacter indicus]|uniref:Aspartate-semialdehyde dehydrogenase n=1 Tax=Janibacter indicus TaxID=857417 RepID=A0A7L9IZJ0_9MICO|nr:Asd/ArgC dimerization domain-containing protein [Janibacter indicus]QOK22412.1 aspartate-semialdehyde dehydrogenase [Janibacter indicus]
MGATGRFAEAIASALALRADTWGEIRLLAPGVSTRTLSIRGQEQTIDSLREDSFARVDVALFNLAPEITPEWAARAVAAGAVVVDASAAFRSDPDVPLVVPGINSHLVAERPKGIVALPGPVTWGLIDAAHVLHQGWELQHLVVTGLIAAVSKSDRGVARLREELHTVAGDPSIGQHPGDVRAAVSDLPVGSPFPAPLALNVIPWVGQPGEGGFTSAELSVGDEVRKVLGLAESVPVVATLVQVPVVLAHSMALHARCARPVAIDKVRAACVAAPSLVHLDEETGEVPTPVDSVGIDPRFVGRIRQPKGAGHHVDMFVSADTTRRGASAMLLVAELVGAQLR